MSLKEDCVFLQIHKNGSFKSCIALEEMICLKKKCPFYKDFETAKKDIKKYGFRKKIK